MKFQKKGINILSINDYLIEKGMQILNEKEKKEIKENIF